uniref:Gag-Pol polyprotein n=1 Tax=Leptobrachium leishanense TaxID=445787 RepID=A0A8C5M720_9ANUR
MPTSDQKVSIVGVSNEIQVANVTKSVPVHIGNLQTEHAFVLSPHSPCNLLGRDLLVKMGVTIALSPEGITINIPDTVKQDATDLLFMPVVALDEEEDKGIPAEHENQIDPRVWVTGTNSAGHMQVPPIRIKRDYSLPVPRLPQYPLTPESVEGIRPVIDDLVKDGVLIPCRSEANTPIYPVPKPLKPGDTTQRWRLVHDLRAVNKVTIPSAPIVPNPSTILATIPPDATYFTVIDLASAFYSIDIHPDDQWLTAFTFEGKQYKWGRLPMGFHDSPTCFSQALKGKLDEWSPTEGSVLVQYVDDLLLASPSMGASVTDSISLMNFLAHIGQRVDKAKVQWVQPKVQYLGHCLSSGVKHLTDKRKHLIATQTFPKTLRQLRAFLGLVGYCRAWIPQYSQVIGPLQDLLKGHTEGKYTYTADELTPEAYRAFRDIKKLLTSAPALGLPNYEKPFFLFCSEIQGYAHGVLTQQFCDKHRPVGYYSYPLDSVARGLPGCLKSVAAAAILVEKNVDIVLGNSLTLMCPHDLETLLNGAYTRHFSTQRLTHYHLTLLSAPNLIIQKCDILNPSTFLPEQIAEEGEGDPHDVHDCTQVLDALVTPRVDLQDFPIEGLPLDAHLFVDGSSLRRPDGVTLAGCAVVNGNGIVLYAAVIPHTTSAQAAELFALCVALELAEGSAVNIYSDSAYAVGVIHTFAQLWKARGFLTAAGSPIQHKALILRLLDAIQLPRRVAVVKCKAHTNLTDFVSRGNACADEHAKLSISQYQPLSMQYQSDVTVDQEILSALQDASSHKQFWVNKGATCSPAGVWMLHDKRVAPPVLFPALFSLSHGPCHVSTGGMTRLVNRSWWAPGFQDYARKRVRECTVCQENNVGRPVKTPPKHVPHTDGPFHIVQIDFSDMPQCGRFKYMLVCVDQFTGWVEAYPTVRNDARTVVKCLTRELIPRFGIGSVISSDRGTHFENKLMAEVTGILGLQQQLHTPYRPEASGMVERTNQTLKRYIAKLTVNGAGTWVDALPLALATVRVTPKEKHGLSPFDILFGRSPVRAPPNPAMLTLQAGQDTLIDYVIKLATVFSDTFSRVKAAQPVGDESLIHGLNPGEWVYIKNHVPKSSLSPKWKGPFQVILVTPTAVKLRNHRHWVHGSHCKKALDPKATTLTGNVVDTGKSPVVSLPPRSPPLTRARAKKKNNVNRTVSFLLHTVIPLTPPVVCINFTRTDLPVSARTSETLVKLTV